MKNRTSSTLSSLSVVLLGIYLDCVNYPRGDSSWVTSSTRLFFHTVLGDTKEQKYTAFRNLIQLF